MPYICIQNCRILSSETGLVSDLPPEEQELVLDEASGKIIRCVDNDHLSVMAGHLESTGRGEKVTYVNFEGDIIAPGCVMFFLSSLTFRSLGN
jgi:hypothetical protein